MRNQNENLILFDPASAYARVNDLRKICEKNHEPDNEIIYAQIGPVDFEVFVKDLRSSTEAMYTLRETSE